ncbi:MAG: hypothetical protein E3J26_02995 [Candidatus Zixiibacteriota bacterium]|nr:MAG: hypothetical protein E3J26_02995 [candidate division Zixibacteria bacterium]
MASKTGEAVKLIPYEDQYLEETLALFKRFSPDHPELADRELFDWQKCQRYLALFKGKVVGHMAQIPQTFKSRGTPVEIGWAATLVLDTSNLLVQTFAGTALLDQLTSHSTLKFAAVGIVPEIEQTHRRRGYNVRRDSVRMYARFINTARALDYLNKSSIWSLPLKIVNLCRRPKAPTDGGEIKSIDRFEPEWDEIWDRLLSEQYEVYPERSADFLNYKISQPHKSYISCIHVNDKGAVDGYIVYRQATHKTKELSLIKICDLVGTKAAQIALLSRAMDYTFESRADGIVGLSSFHDKDTFRKCGLWISRVYPVVLPPEIEGRIHITFFESDLDDLW